MEVLLDVDVEGCHASCIVLHSLFQLGGIRASQTWDLHLSEMGEYIRLGYQHASRFGDRWFSHSKLLLFLYHIIIDTNIHLRNFTYNIYEFLFFHCII